MAAGGVEAWNTSELLAACCGAAVKVWSPISAEPRREVKLSEGTDVHALDWSGNNKVLAVAGDKAQITMVGGGKVIGYVPEAIDPSLSGITAMRFSADSKKLAIGCANRTVHIRDLRSQVRLDWCGSVLQGARGCAAGDPLSTCAAGRLECSSAERAEGPPSGPHQLGDMRMQADRCCYAAEISVKANALECTH